MSIDDFIRELRKGVGFVTPKKETDYEPMNKSRAAEMVRLRFEESKTLQEIANVYGISRERVRQIIGNSGSGYKLRRNRKKILSHPELTNDELSEYTGISVNVISTHRAMAGQRHTIKDGGHLKSGTEGEIIVSDKLRELGIEHKLMGHMHKFDIILKNGKRIDVKTADSAIKPPSQHGGAYYNFRITKFRSGQESYADFFILLIKPENKFYVIPENEIAKSYLRITQSPLKKEKLKYDKYINRFDLLQN